MNQQIPLYNSITISSGRSRYSKKNNNNNNQRTRVKRINAYNTQQQPKTKYSGKFKREQTRIEKVKELQNKIVTNMFAKQKTLNNHKYQPNTYSEECNQPKNKQLRNF